MTSPTRPRRRVDPDAPPRARIVDALAQLQGLSQDAAAAVAGVHRGTLWRYRHGASAFSPAQEAALAAALRCDVRVLQSPTETLADAAELLTRAELGDGLLGADGAVHGGPVVPPGVRLSPEDYAALYPAIVALEREAAARGYAVDVRFIAANEKVVTRRGTLGA